MAPEASEAASRRDQAAGRSSRKSTKQRTLELIKSLEETDDERTGISKKISWILRHGAQRVNVKMDQDGWVKVSDLLAAEILDEVKNEETLMAVIVDSNAQKLRYKLKESSEGQYIKAYSKTERKATTGSVPPPVAEPERKSQTLRQEAQPFIPSTFSPVAGLPPVGYPWPLAGGFGFGPMMPQWPGAYPPMAPFPGMEGAMGLPQGRYRGRIKSFNQEKGFGFIECAETHAQFDRDVFLHKAQYGDMSVGTEVTFKVETNKQGMPQAKDLAPIGVSGALLPGSGKAGRGKGKGGRGKGGGRGQGKGSGGKGERGGKGASKEPAQAGDVSTEAAGATDATSAAPSAGPSEAEAAAPSAEAAAPAAEAAAAAAEAAAAPAEAAAAPAEAAGASAEAAAPAVDQAAASAAASAPPASTASAEAAPAEAASTAPSATGKAEATEATAQEAAATEPAAAASAG